MKHVKNAYIPALFIAAKEDDFILPHHTDKLYEAYSGDKEKVLVEGDHNSRRDSGTMDKVSSFLFYGLYVNDLVKSDQEYIEEQKKNKEKKEEELPAHNFMENFVVGYQEVDEEEELKRALEESLKLQDENKKKEE